MSRITGVDIHITGTHGCRDLREDGMLAQNCEQHRGPGVRQTRCT